MIQLVGLDESYLDKFPSTLSGGEKQRIGVARALAADPDILLMDEPFGAVDEITRKVLTRRNIKNSFRTFKKTIIFVTHDIEEAMKLGSKIVLFNKGKIEQIGTKEEMVFRPASEYVKSFFGFKNFLAYMSVMKLREFYVLDKTDNKNDSNFEITTDTTIIEGIKKLYDLGVTEIELEGTKDKKEIFSIPKLKERIDLRL